MCNDATLCSLAVEPLVVIEYLDYIYIIHIEITTLLVPSCVEICLCVCVFAHRIHLYRFSGAYTTIYMQNESGVNLVSNPLPKHKLGDEKKEATTTTHTVYLENIHQ